MSADGTSPAPKSGRAPRRLPRVVRLMRARPRLFLAAALAAVLGVVLPAEWRLVTRLLVAWVAGVAIYLPLASSSMINSDAARIRRRAALLDEDRVAFLLLTAGAALAS